MVSRRLVGSVLILGVVGFLGWRLLHHSGDHKQATPAVPVIAGKATAKDMPVLVRGLGTVQAYNMVMVKSRVDGQITQVLFNEGQEVTAGQPLFQIDPRPFQAALDQAQANLQKDEAQLEGARLDLVRYGKLVGPGFQTRQSYDDQKALVGQLEGATKADQAAIETNKLNLDYAVIKSPITGRTGARLVDIGNFVQASQGTNLVTITQMKPIFVTFTVPQENLDGIRRAETSGPLTVEAYAGDDKTLLGTGKLTLVNNQVDTTTGTIQLKATFANDDERLWPGAFINAHLILSIRKDAVTVPAQAVMQGPNGTFAYVIKPDDTVQQTDVKVAATQDGLAVIDSGLRAGDPVVVDGQYRLTNGSKIKTDSAPAQQKQASAVGQ
jgi:multidrug efflux system membrane fusion protein